MSDMRHPDGILLAIITVASILTISLTILLVIIYASAGSIALAVTWGCVAVINLMNLAIIWFIELH